MMRLLIPIVLACIGACVHSPTQNLKVGESPHVECSDPRPEACTREYRPVCAARDTGTRCVTQPCDALELKTYPNACTACSDQEVFGYHQGECERQDAT